MKRLRYKRVVGVGIITLVLIFIMFYLFMNKNQFYEYSGTIETYVCSYRQDDKVYTFDLKGFKEEKMYVSLNDMYNMIVILDKNAHVYIDKHRHTMVCEMNDKIYYFDYGQDEISYDDKSIDMSDYQSHIYISHKNVYIRVDFIEKILLNNKKKISFKNKTAIIS